jgi:hypothetical protein
VQFDAAAAEAVLTALKSAIATLGTSGNADLGKANKALEGWKGVWADQFAGGSLIWMASESGRILNGMLELQSQISGAIGAARRLQAQHNLANQRWAAQHHQPVP